METPLISSPSTSSNLTPEVVGTLVAIGSGMILMAQFGSLALNWNDCSRGVSVESLGGSNLLLSSAALLTAGCYRYRSEHLGCTKTSVLFFGATAVASAVILIIQAIRCP